MLGYRQRPKLRRPLAAQEAGLPMFSDGNPSNQTTISWCFPPKAAGRSELGINVVLEVAQRCQGAEDALQAAELSGTLFAEVDVAGQEGAGVLDTFSRDEKWF